MKKMLVLILASLMLCTMVIFNVDTLTASTDRSVEEQGEDAQNQEEAYEPAGQEEEQVDEETGEEQSDEESGNPEDDQNMHDEGKDRL